MVFTTDPPAADIVREYNVIEANVGKGEVCNFEWEKSRDKVEVIGGRIIGKGKDTNP